MNEEIELLLKRQETFDPSAELDRRVRRALAEAQVALKPRRHLGTMSLLALPLAVAAATIIVVMWLDRDSEINGRSATQLAQPIANANRPPLPVEPNDAGAVVRSDRPVIETPAKESEQPLRLTVSQDLGCEEGLVRLSDDTSLRYVRVRSFERGVVYKPDEKLTISYQLPIERVVFSPIVTY